MPTSRRRAIPLLTASGAPGSRIPRLWSSQGAAGVRRRYLAAALALALCGCGTATAERAGGGPGRALTPAERALLDHAEQELVADCMRRQGFQYTVVTPPEPLPDFPHGNDDVAWARAHGFGIAESNAIVTRLRERDPNQRYFERLPRARQRAYMAALDGDRRNAVSVRLPDGLRLHASRGGCAADAKRRLYGDFERWFEVSTRVGHLPSSYRSELPEDPRYRAALASWVGCMRARGFDASDPVGLRAKVTAPLGDSWAVKDEVPAAVAEAECADRTGLVRTATRLEREYRARAYAEHPDLVAEYQAMSVTALERARRDPGTEP